tara:strand:+ start:1207 stop:1527 length:321 start_codon:yes stop_codon:yes gene_type:complete
MYIYKIYFATDVEYKQTNKLISELETLFLNNNIKLDGFSIINSNGYYRQEIEKSYIFEYIENLSYFNDKMGTTIIIDNLIKKISKLIKGYYKQKEVLTTKQKIDIL